MQRNENRICILKVLQTKRPIYEWYNLFINFSRSENWNILFLINGSHSKIGCNQNERERMREKIFQINVYKQLNPIGHQQMHCIALHREIKSIEQIVGMTKLKSKRIENEINQFNWNVKRARGRELNII